MEMTADSWDAMKAEGTKHLQAVHPEMAEGMKNQAPEAMAKWDADSKAKFDASPDAQ